MNRQQLEHVIRASANIAEDDDIVVVGSQSILGQFPDAPAELLESMAADVYPRNKPEAWELIDGSIGELSPFHRAFGYYAHGVGEETSTLPAGWKERLVPIRNENTRGATGWCLEVHDLLIAKAVAGREKDLSFISAALSQRLADRATLGRRLAETLLASELRAIVEARIARA
ncbi:MAG: DUF6036 family nucleotidyltransferase [Acidobacteriota bacterium]